MASRSAIAALLNVCMLLPLCGCKPATVYRNQFLAMGTVVGVAIGAQGPQQAALASEEVAALANRLGREWYAWTPDGSGELARLNTALSRGAEAVVSPELGDLLRRSDAFAAASEGCFDPTVGQLVALWGFTGSERTSQPLPGAVQIAAWRAHRPTFAQLRIGRDRVRADIPLQLDLGAIAKGRFIDLAIDALRRRDVRNALIDAGGNIRVIGQAERGPWRIAIRSPRSAAPLAWLALRDGESVSTSGDYEHYAMVNGRRVHHILDPRSGEPVAHTMAVTVVAADATLADAASTALMVAGPDAWRRIARRLGIRYALRIDAAGHMEMSSALHSRLHFSATVPHGLRIVEL